MPSTASPSCPWAKIYPSTQYKTGRDSFPAGFFLPGKETDSGNHRNCPYFWEISEEFSFVFFPETFSVSAQKNQKIKFYSV
jgi:hypothetical protein